jgi:ribosomal protein S18 acetylase RimI-like enzyme
MIFRRATLADLDFLACADVTVDLEDEGVIVRQSEVEVLANRPVYRQKIARFVTAADKCVWICEDPASGLPVGMIMGHFRDRRSEAFDEFESDWIFRALDDNLFPADGRFCEVFQLWVHPDYRRQGLGTRLKQQLEIEARQRGVSMIYTHTRQCNQHVIALNKKLGYQEVRRGPIWDEVIRVSLVKRL